MFDFSKYNLGELVAISDMLDYIEHGGCVDYQQEKCREAINQNVSRQAIEQLQTFRESLVRAWFIEQAEQAAQAEAEKVNRIKDACVAGAPPADPPADPPAEPDMFGWVGDALDDLCAAGEVLGSND